MQRQTINLDHAPAHGMPRPDLDLDRIPTRATIEANILDYWSKCQDLTYDEFNDPDIWWEIAERLSVNVNPIKWALNRPTEFSRAWQHVIEDVRIWTEEDANDFALITGQAWIKSVSNVVAEMMPNVINPLPAIGAEVLAKWPDGFRAWGEVTDHFEDSRGFVITSRNETFSVFPTDGDTWIETEDQ